MSASEISNACYDAKKQYISTAQQSDYFKKNKAGFYEPSSKWDPKSEPLSCEDMERGIQLASKIEYRYWENFVPVHLLASLNTK